jgi:hypothetical protein
MPARGGRVLSVVERRPLSAAVEPADRPRANLSAASFGGARTLGHRSREWTAVAPTELEVVREMARCLAIIGDGRWPE